MATFNSITPNIQRLGHARQLRSLPRRVFIGGTLTLVSFALLYAVWGWT